MDDFPQKLKKVVRVVLYNQITGKPVHISCHLIMQCELDFHGLTKYLYRLYREIRAPKRVDKS